MKRIRDFVAVDPALQPDPSAWEGLDRSRPAEHTVETRIRIVVYSKHNCMQAYFGIMDLYFSHLLELVSAVPYLPGCRFAAYQVTQGDLLDVVRPKTRRRHSLQHAAPHQDSSHVLACVSQCKMICECNIPRYLITHETPPRSHKQFGIIPRHPSCQAQQYGNAEHVYTYQSDHPIAHASSPPPHHVLCSASPPHNHVLHHHTPTCVRARLPLLPSSFLLLPSCQPPTIAQVRTRMLTRLQQQQCPTAEP